MGMSAAETTNAPSEDERMQQQKWMREEARLARPFLGRLPWEMVAWGLGNFVFWLALWPLVIFEVVDELLDTVAVVKEFSAETIQVTIDAISSTVTKRSRGIFDSM